MVLRRLDPGVNVASLDRQLNARYMRQAHVVMYGADWASVTATFGVEQAIWVKHTAFGIAEPIVNANRGACVEEQLWVFPSAVDVWLVAVIVVVVVVVVVGPVCDS